MFEALNNLKFKRIVSAVDFRKNMAAYTDMVRQGYAVILTSNSKEKAVLISPEDAEKYYTENEQSLRDPEFKPMTEENLQAAAAAAGVDMDEVETEIAEEEAPENEVVEEPANLPDTVEEAAPIRERFPRLDTHLPDCPGCLDSSKLHETFTAQHPDNDSIPESVTFVRPMEEVAPQAPEMRVDEVLPQGEQPHTSEAPVASSVEESTAEASEPQTEPESVPDAESSDSGRQLVDDAANVPASDTEKEDLPPTCDADKAVPALVCNNPAAAFVRWRDVEMNICQHHLDQLIAKNQEFNHLGDPR